MKKMKKLLYLFVALCLVACEDKNSGSASEDFVDLGLPSGTKWKNANEINPDSKYGFYTFDDALKQFKQNLPTKEQYEELIKECSCSLSGNQCLVTGPNGKSITFSAGGFIYNDNLCNPEVGYYWSSTPENSTDAWMLYFQGGEYNKIIVGCNWRICSQPVRLVK